MALNKQEIIKRKWKSILTKNGSKIFRLYFLKERSQEEIKKILREEYMKEHRGKRINSDSLNNLVSGYTSGWIKLRYINSRKVKLKEPKSKSHPYEFRYSSNINFYFEYAKSKLGGKEFHQLIKGILNYIFSFKEVREIASRHDNLIYGITSFLARIFLSKSILEDDILGLQFIKGFC